MQIIRTKKASVRAISLILSLILLIAAVPITASSVWYDKADYNDIKTDDLEAMRLQLKEYDKMLAELKADEEDLMDETEAIDYEAIALYEELTGTALDFGVVFAGYDNLGGKQPLDESGNAIILEKVSKVIKLFFKNFMPVILRIPYGIG